jgi:acetyltransferase-like isoleucine patch superfamily enzyme
MDYGHNVRLGKNIFINFNSVFLDTCLITIGDRTLVGPNCSFYSATHPLDPALRNGLRGPELGKEIHVGEDCWIGGNVVILPGVTIGKGSVGTYGSADCNVRLLTDLAPRLTVGAGSVVTKSVPEYTVVAGNPARIIRNTIETAMDPSQQKSENSA